MRAPRSIGSNPCHSSVTVLLSEYVAFLNKKMPENKYDDHDWDELPEEVKEAAKKLGYKKKIWDKDGKTPADDLDW